MREVLGDEHSPEEAEEVRDELEQRRRAPRYEHEHRQQQWACG
jgi:hypothetical protein